MIQTIILIGLFIGGLYFFSKLDEEIETEEIKGEEKQEQNIGFDVDNITNSFAEYRRTNKNTKLTYLSIDDMKEIVVLNWTKLSRQAQDIVKEYADKCEELDMLSWLVCDVLECCKKDSVNRIYLKPQYC